MDRERESESKTTGINIQRHYCSEELEAAKTTTVKQELNAHTRVPTNTHIHTWAQVGLCRGCREETNATGKNVCAWLKKGRGGMTGMCVWMLVSCVCVCVSLGGGRS